MKKLTVMVIGMFAAGAALAQPAAQHFIERFGEMQIQSGATFPTAPPYERAPTFAAESPALASTDMKANQKKDEFADRIGEMQKWSGAKFVTAPLYGSTSSTALAKKENGTGTKIR